MRRNFLQIKTINFQIINIILINRCFSNEIKLDYRLKNKPNQIKASFNLFTKIFCWYIMWYVDHSEDSTHDKYN